MNLIKKGEDIANSLLNGQFTQARQQAKGLSVERVMLCLIESGCSVSEAWDLALKAKGR